MPDYTETERQAGPVSAGTADTEKHDLTAARTDTPPGRSNGSRQQLDQYSIVVDSRQAPEAKRKTQAAVPFKKGVFREYFESAVVTFVMALFGMTFIVQ